ncbi:unnamed protein product [Notodromas monacha]|uniref:Uncharacterized protein n=1 Tax=Notodromas monacha TaxID=399045 RepID=A0A7R9GB70_9CRUS|nr:unnamed protein product [Notodromas monacha]CAG0914499.1 unnamed protein product [Notodromas monacha]
MDRGWDAFIQSCRKGNPEMICGAAILQLAVQYIYQLEQEKTQLLTRNCELKRQLDQAHSKDPVNDGLHSSGTPSPSVVVSVPQSSNGSVGTNGGTSISVPVTTVKREYANQMHLPPMKRKRAYALAEAEAEADEGEKRVRNIATAVAAVGNSAGLMHHPPLEHNYQSIEQETETTDVKPPQQKHVMVGVGSLSPASNQVAAVSMSQHQVYVQPHQAQNSHHSGVNGASETLQQQLMALQRELDQERGYRIALEDKTRSLEAKGENGEQVLLLMDDGSLGHLTQATQAITVDQDHRVSHRNGQQQHHIPVQTHHSVSHHQELHPGQVRLHGDAVVRVQMQDASSGTEDTPSMPGTGLTVGKGGLPPVNLAFTRMGKGSVALNALLESNFRRKASFPSSQKSLETIVEAIRHLEGDQMFESMVQTHSTKQPEPAYHHHHNHHPVHHHHLQQQRMEEFCGDDEDQPLALTIDAPVSSAPSLRGRAGATMVKYVDQSSGQQMDSSHM